MSSTYTKLLYHIVYSTKHRKTLITPELEPPLYAYIGGIVRGEGGTLLEIGGIPDHVHLVTRLKAHPSVAGFIKVFKSKASKWVNERSDQATRFSWQVGYGAFTVSASQLAHVRQYVRNQKEHHRTISFQEEFIALLEKHDVEYDERYIWD